MVNGFDSITIAQFPAMICSVSADSRRLLKSCYSLDLDISSIDFE